MYKVKNKKAIRRLSDRNFRAGRTRNRIAVLAIILTSVLFTALFTIAGGIVDCLQRQTMRQAGGDGMAVLKYMTQEEYQAVKDHELIEEISYNRLLCDEVRNEGLKKRHGELYYMDDTAIKLGFCEPTHGRKPEAADEIIMDTRAIELLGIEPRIGEPVRLLLTVHGREVTRDFVLSGWWEADPAFHMASIMVTSRAYMEEHLDELYNSIKENYEMTGAINSYIMFRDAFALEEKLARVITESGFSQNSDDPNYLEANVNWAYMSTSMDAGTVLAITGVAALIAVAGYLIIYNIFQISVIRDIRFYGLLKTIGTTKRQIRSMIRRQAMWLCLMGIPAGLLFGYIIGRSLIPAMMNAMQWNDMEMADMPAPSPAVFAGSMLFTVLTVCMSTAKPGRIAAGVSPMEAVRYTDGGSRKRRHTVRVGKKSRHSADISRMAAANLGRDRKRTVLVLLSMSLSLVLFNSVYTVSLGFDMDKYLQKFVDMDFLVAHVDYFNYIYGGAYNEVSQELIEEIEKQPGFLEGGRYLHVAYMTPEIFRAEEPEQYVAYRTDNRDSEGYIFTDVYGAEDVLLERLEVIEGEIDFEKLRSGEYILEGVKTDDREMPIWETSHYDIGDTVVLHNYRGTGQTAEENEFCTWEYKVMAKVAVKSYTNANGRFDGFSSFYLPEDVYRNMVMAPGVMNYSFNVKDGAEEDMEAFLKDYTKNTNMLMDYRSKEVYVDAFENMQHLVVLVGGGLSLVIGMIGVLNFINSMLTSIITRRREFAMLQSIGMTKRQLRHMLVMEGLYYTAGAGSVSLLLGAAVSAGPVKALLEGIWFCRWHFTVTPLLATLPVLLLFGVGLPYLLIRMVERQSIVERLRECE